MFYKDNAKKRKRVYIISFFVLVAMMMGGYFLGLQIGKKNLSINMNKPVADLDTPKAEPVDQSLETGADPKIANIGYTGKISEETRLIFQKYYLGCGHSQIEERNALGSELGLSLDEIMVKFDQWEISQYTDKELVLKREIDDFCPEHFILRDRAGMLILYMPPREGKDNRTIEETQIFTNTLPPDIQNEVQRGLVLDSLEDVEHFLENLES